MSGQTRCSPGSPTTSLAHLACHQRDSSDLGEDRLDPEFLAALHAFTYNGAPPARMLWVQAEGWKNRRVPAVLVARFNIQHTPRVPLGSLPGRRGLSTSFHLASLHPRRPKRTDHLLITPDRSHANDTVGGFHSLLPFPRCILWAFEATEGGEMRTSLMAAVLCVILAFAVNCQTATPKFTDKAECDLYVRIGNESSANEKVKLLLEWRKLYPSSELAQVRLSLLLSACHSAGLAAPPSNRTGQGDRAAPPRTDRRETDGASSLRTDRVLVTNRLCTTPNPRPRV
jgi:hypothetical protein